MFCSRTSNNTINKIDKRALRLILKDQTNDACNYHRNFQTLIVEIYKIKNNLNLPIMDFMFERRNNTYNLRNFQEFATKTKGTVKVGLETLNYRFQQLWSILPENLRHNNSLVPFKESVKKWDCTDCPCRLCKLYWPDIGFLQYISIACL